jgi:DNA-binding transcriptional MerR regulator
MRIGELAGLVGISTRAIRHYHRVGLLAEPANGYREYSLRDAVELARVRRLTELGLSLDEAGDALAGDAGRDLVGILRELDADLARQEADLRQRRARLAELLRRVRQPRVLPHHRRPDRRRMDLLGHRHPAPPAQLTIQRGAAGRRFRGNARGADGGGQLLHGAQARG